MGAEDGWAEWSKHVLKELERLNDNHEALRTKLEDVQKSITEIKSGHTEMSELKEWKKNMDEVMSPTQLKEMQKTVEDLKTFKAKAVAVAVVVHGLIGIALTILALA